MQTNAHNWRENSSELREIKKVVQTIEVILIRFLLAFELVYIIVKISILHKSWEMDVNYRDNNKSFGMFLK